MNELRLERSEELVKWLSSNLNRKGLYILHTSLVESDIINCIEHTSNSIFYRLNSVPGQPFLEAVTLLFSHKIKDSSIKSLTTSFLIGPAVSRTSIVEEILFRCFEHLKNNQVNTILLIMSGSSEKTDDIDKTLLDKVLTEQEGNVALVLIPRNEKSHIYRNEIGITMNKEDKVHISYKHLDRHNTAIDGICRGLEAANISYSIDKHDIEIRDSIQEYEEEIGRSKRVIVIITPEYLHSIQCMYEIKEIIKNGDIVNRIIPIVDLEDISRDSEGLRKIKDYWQKKMDQKIEQAKTEPGQKKVLIDELSIINDIIIALDDVWLYISKHLTGTICDMSFNDAEKLVVVIKKMMDEEIGTINIGGIAGVSDITSNAVSPSYPTRNINQGANGVYIENNSGNIKINFNPSKQ